jgi:hypothetical protein
VGWKLEAGMLGAGVEEGARPGAVREREKKKLRARDCSVYSASSSN